MNASFGTGEGNARFISMLGKLGFFDNLPNIDIYIIVSAQCQVWGADMRTPSELRARSLAMHQLVVAKIRQDPTLFLRARATLSRWRQTVCLSSQPYLMEWERLMEQGMDVTLAKAVEDSEHAADLRKSSPFAGILTNQERFAFLRDWSRRYDPEPHLGGGRHDA